MESSQNPIYNLFTNLTRNQKIALCLAVILFISGIIILPQLFQTNQSETNNNDELSNSPKVESYVDEQGYTVTTETITNSKGEESITSTRTDPYGNTTTTDPDLLTTYFPYQVMRQHKEWTNTLRYYLSVNETKKTIHAIVEDCDIDQDKAMIQAYIRSIPIDLSDYTVEYELNSVDADCGE